MRSGLEAYPTEDVDRRGLDANLRAGPQMREYAHIADRVAAAAAGPVLDWGCGFGQLSAMLRARGAEVESYDYRAGEPPHQIELERFPGITATISDEPVALPYADDQFGAVLSCGVLEHVQDPAASLDELHRILRPGGRLFVYKLPNRRSYLEAIAKRIGLYYHGSLPFDTLYGLDSAAALITAHRFRIDELRYANMLPLSMSAGATAWRFADEIWKLNRMLASIPVLRRVATNVEAVATAV